MGIGSVMQHKAIFLDRDGVLNAAIIKDGKPYPPASINELIIPFGVLDALTNLKKAGFLLIAATNQPDVARGKVTRTSVELINNALMSQLPLDDLRVCFHDDAEHCACRKPAPGLLQAAALDHHIHLNNSFMIGDRWKDIEAGQRAGCQTIWLDYQYAEKSPDKAPDYTTTTLMDAANWIIKNTTRSSKCNESRI